MNKWTEDHILQLHKHKKIRGYSFPQTPKKYARNPEENIPREKPKAIAWLDLNLQYWCNERSVSLQCAANGGELRFDPERKFRFDYAIAAYMIAVEFEGGIFMQRSGHNTAKHYTKDTDKYNRAAVLGWRVIRVTAMNYTTVLKTLNDMVK